jgi:small-conductance mechanosensitive channel
LLEAIKTTFDEQGINIPYPQRDIHMIQQTAA